MGYQNNPDGTKSNFSHVSEIGPKMWSQDGNCAHFGFCLGTKSPMMDPPNHALRWNRVNLCVDYEVKVCEISDFILGSYPMYFAQMSKMSERF